MGIGEGEGKLNLLGDRVAVGNQRFLKVLERVQAPHPGVTTLEGSISENKVQEERVAVEVREGELMMCDEWFCELEETTKRRRLRGGVSYTP